MGAIGNPIKRKCHAGNCVSQCESSVHGGLYWILGGGGTRWYVALKPPRLSRLCSTQFSVPFEVIACLTSQVYIFIKKFQQFSIFWFPVKYFLATCRRIQRQMCGRCWNKRHLDKMSQEAGGMWSASEIASLTFESAKNGYFEFTTDLAIAIGRLVDSLLTLIFYINAPGSRPWNTRPWTQRLSELLDKLCTVNEKSNYLFSPPHPWISLFVGTFIGIIH